MKKGFTLIELLVAIAIIGILAGVVLVSTSSYRSTAKSAKLTGSLSSVIPNMQNCWSFGGEVNTPYNNSQICSLASSYGNWPDVSTGGYSYSDISYAFLPDDSHQENFRSFLSNFLVPTTKATVAGPSYLSKTNWYFSAVSSTDSKKVCCNQKMSGCKIIGYSDACNASTS